jgi:hypothetical protein
MVLSTPKTINGITALFTACSLTGAVLSVPLLLAFFIQPQRNIDPIQVWILPASAVFYGIAAVWYHKWHENRKK